MSISKAILSLILFLSSIHIQSIDYKKIEKHVENTPQSITKSTTALSKYLTDPFDKEDERFAAIYFWIGKNIKYDVSQRNSNRKYFSTKEFINEVMKYKKGVCQHYSELFKELSILAGLESHVISGYGKTDGNISGLAHAWNAIKVNENWYFVDATWGAGYVSHGIYKYDFRLKYFMVKPEKFVEDHMPFDPMWQLLKFPFKYEEFDLGTKKSTHHNEFFYEDSIKNYLKLPEIEQIQARIRRIDSNGKKNILVKNEIKQEKTYLSISVKNIDIGNINSGNYLFNTALKQYNDFYDNIGSNYKPVKHKELPELYDIEKKIQQAKQYYAKVKTNDPQIVQKLKQAKSAVKSLENIVNKRKKILMNN
ncbi:MAG: transglutaminase domain-containing protein [Bacteroidota bacterium]